jgi:hypothetical protein
MNVLPVKSWVFGCLGWMLLAGAAAGWAQVVNIESRRLQDAKDGWAGRIDFRVDYNRNVNEILKYGFATQVQYRKGISKTLWLTDANLLRVNGDYVINNGFLHLREGLWSHKRWSVEAYLQAQRNVVQLVQFRWLMGLGGRLRVVDQDSIPLRAYLGTSYMYEYEEEVPNIDNNTGTQNRYHRLSNYVNLGYDLNQTVTIVSILYYQPRLDRWKDYRFSTANTLRVRLGRHTNFVSVFSLQYDANPPGDLVRTLIGWENGLGFTF